MTYRVSASGEVCQTGNGAKKERLGYAWLYEVFFIGFDVGIY